MTNLAHITVTELVLTFHLPVAFCAAGSCRAELGSLAQPPNMATVIGVTMEQQRTLAILWPRLISS